jgi:lipopolysaccharide/colanic/teichoic acid biosynthesis glycosyltransferase
VAARFDPDASPPESRQAGTARSGGLESLRDPRPVTGRVVKRALDLALALILVVLSAPLLGLACLAIRVESAGSPIYRQRRVGKGGRPFDLYKLRTMVSGAENMGAGLAVDEGDPRITRVGALLRRLSLDEVPNLLNVLRGEMSLVGPRPTVQVQVDQYSERQRGRLAVEPGITGWAQVKGRAALPWHERIELDLWYVEHWSLRLDLRILATTVKLLATGKGLYRGATGGWRP